MTSQKSFKSRVRVRMSKTGESYTAARRHLLKKLEPAPPAAPATEAIRAHKPPEASLRERTGHGLDEWFARLDAWGASERTHTDIARWLVTEHQVDSWWAQSLTVGYEQARGMRAPGQQRDGGFSVSGSRTVAVSVDRLFQAFADESIRHRWLPGIKLRVRTATAPKSFRADWADGPTRIVAGFTPKGDAKAQVAVLHERLPDAAAAAEMKAYWRERLTALKGLLEP
jgi:hypothetical protein